MDGSITKFNYRYKLLLVFSYQSYIQVSVDTNISQKIFKTSVIGNEVEIFCSRRNRLNDDCI